MKKIILKRTILKADDGKVLTNGTIYGNTIYLANGESANDYKEITLEEYRTILAEEELKAAQMTDTENISSEEQEVTENDNNNGNDN